MYVIRRAVGHLKREDKDWTFLYFCDPFPGFEQSAYVPDVPGGSLPPLDDWANGLLSSNTPDEYLDRLAADGFGFVTKILRDIKSSWKLLLSDMETFLEDLVSHNRNPRIAGLTKLVYRTTLSMTTSI